MDEFIYDSAEFPSVHAATIAETPSGLITAFFGGKYEGHPEVNIYTVSYTHLDVYKRQVSICIIRSCKSHSKEHCSKWELIKNEYLG